MFRLAFPFTKKNVQNIEEWGLLSWRHDTNGPQVLKECCKDKSEFTFRAQPHFLMLLPHPTQFTNRTSWYPHVVTCLFSWLLAFFFFFFAFYLHIMAQFNSQLLSKASHFSKAELVTLSITPQHSHITLKWSIRSQIPPNRVKKLYHSPLYALSIMPDTGQ